MFAQVKADLRTQLDVSDVKVWAGSWRGILDILIASVSGCEVRCDQQIGGGHTIEQAATTGFFSLRYAPSLTLRALTWQLAARAMVYAASWNLSCCIPQQTSSTHTKDPMQVADGSPGAPGRVQCVCSW